MVFAEKRQKTAQTRTMRERLIRSVAPAIFAPHDGSEQAEIAFGNARFRKQWRRV
jgi:hypothetical protein